MPPLQPAATLLYIILLCQHTQQQVQHPPQSTDDFVFDSFHGSAEVVHHLCGRLARSANFCKQPKDSVLDPRPQAASIEPEWTGAAA